MAVQKPSSSDNYPHLWKEIVVKPHIMAVALVFIGAHIFFLITYYTAPNSLALLTQEDGAFENLQAVCYFVACILSMTALLNRDHLLGRFWIAVFALGFLFIAGEEISWGQRIFDFHVESVEKHSVQGEFNLHNYPLIPISPSRILSILSLAFGVLLPVAITFSRTLRVWLVDCLHFPVPHPVVLICFTLSYLWYRTHHAGSPIPAAIEESRELTIALGFLVYTLLLRSHNTHIQTSTRPKAT